MTIFVRQSLWFCFIARVATILFSEKKRNEKKKKKRGTRTRKNRHGRLQLCRFLRELENRGFESSGQRFLSSKGQELDRASNRQ